MNSYYQIQCCAKTIQQINREWVEVSSMGMGMGMGKRFDVALHVNQGNGEVHYLDGLHHDPL
jgi:hypothetical protein